MGSVGFKCVRTLCENRGENSEKIIKQPVSSGKTKLADRTQCDNVRLRPYAYGRGKPLGEREKEKESENLISSEPRPAYERYLGPPLTRWRGPPPPVVCVFISNVVDAFLSPLRSFVLSFLFGPPNLHRRPPFSPIRHAVFRSPSIEHHTGTKSTKAFLTVTLRMRIAFLPLSNCESIHDTLSKIKYIKSYATHPISNKSFFSSKPFFFFLFITFIFR